MQFSIHRIWLLTRKQWAENQQLYILGLLAIAGIIAATVIFNLIGSQGFEKRVQENTLIIGLLASGFVFATTTLSRLNQKTAGINVLMLPASTLEKLAVAAIYSMLVFPVCFLVVVYPLIAIGHYVDHNIIGRPNSLYFINADEKVFGILPAFLVIQSTALFSTILFRRYVLLKGVILIMIVFFGTLILNPFLAKSIIKTNPGTPIAATVKETYYDARHNIVKSKVTKEPLWTNIWSTAPYSDIQINNWVVNKKFNGVDYVSYSIVITNPYSSVFILLFIISIPFLWLITWFRLKEKEL
jgi:hypothetical protein